MAARAGLSGSLPQEDSTSSIQHPSSPRQASPCRSQLGPELSGRKNLADLGENTQTDFLAWIKEEMRKEMRDLLSQAFPKSRRDFSSDSSRRRSSPSSSSGSGSKESNRSSGSPPRRKRRRLDAEGSPLLGDEDQDSEYSDSSSYKEEGESSEEEEPTVTTVQNRLFPQEVSHKLLPKVLRVLDIPVSHQEGGTPDRKKPRAPAETFLKAGSAPLWIPFPDTFDRVVRSEWESPARPKSNHPLLSRFYSLVPEAAARFELPLVDDPVAGLRSDSVLLADADGLPRDPCDRGIEQSLRKNFEASATSLRASTASSLFARAIYVWASDLSAADSDVPKPLKDSFKKIALAAAFSADASLDAVQLSARAMAANVTTRRNTWLRSWGVDPSVRAKLVGKPFKGIQLFGEGYLAEDKGKKKALPSHWRDTKPKKRSSSFREPKRTSGSRASRPSKWRWHPKQPGGNNPSFTSTSGRNREGPKKSTSACPSQDPRDRPASNVCNSRGSYCRQQVGAGHGKKGLLNRTLLHSSQQIPPSAKEQLPTETPSSSQCHPTSLGDKSDTASAGSPKDLGGLLSLLFSSKEERGHESHSRPQMAKQEDKKEAQDRRPQVHSVINTEGRFPGIHRSLRGLFLGSELVPRAAGYKLNKTFKK